MTAKKTRQVVIINDIQSESIEQAIFILRTPLGEPLPASPGGNIVDEAQRIINSYVKTIEGAAPKWKNDGRSAARAGRTKRICYVVAAALAFAAAAVLCTCFFDVILQLF